mmetsp:Transcript_16379/g.47033  ORF Transcript_16379/g.47033 Transcript_16379/m.47033 type:complete len:353 (+) Transcript_16379:1553-2611(+)
MALVLVLAVVEAALATILTIISRAAVHTAAAEAEALPLLELEAIPWNGGGVTLILSSTSGTTCYTSRMMMISDQSSTVTLPVAAVCTTHRSTINTMLVLPPTSKGGGASRTALLRVLLPSGRLVTMATTIAPRTAEAEELALSRRICQLRCRLHSPRPNSINTNISISIMVFLLLLLLLLSSVQICTLIGPRTIPHPKQVAKCAEDTQTRASKDGTPTTCSAVTTIQPLGANQSNRTTFLAQVVEGVPAAAVAVTQGVVVGTRESLLVVPCRNRLLMHSRMTTTIALESLPHSSGLPQSIFTNMATMAVITHNSSLRASLPIRTSKRWRHLPAWVRVDRVVRTALLIERLPK